MARSNASCEWGHTSLHAGKNAARNECFHRVPSNLDIITISPAALDEINTIRWNVPIQKQGRILVVDQDPGAVEIAGYIREGDPRNGKPSEYPRLRFHREQEGDIRNVVRAYLIKFGARNLGAIDLDLTGTVDQIIPIAQSVVGSVRECKFRRGVQLFVTYRNGRDEHGWNASDNRVKCLATKLVGVKPTFHMHYRSDWRDRNLARKFGSSMTVAGFKF